MQEEYWVTKENKKIAVSDLSETHAKNILRLLLRHKRFEEESDALEEKYIGELSDNGEWYRYNGND